MTKFMDKEHFGTANNPLPKVNSKTVWQMDSVSTEILIIIVTKENLKIACTMVKVKKPGQMALLSREFIKTGVETEKVLAKNQGAQQNGKFGEMAYLYSIRKIMKIFRT